METDEISQETEVGRTLVGNDYPHYFALYALSSSTPINLELQCTDMSVASETKFRPFITRRLESCAVRYGEGSLCSLEFRLSDTLDNPICYYAQMIRPILAAFSDSDEGDLDLTEKFVVCFLTSSEVNLEFFRLELQEFCKNAVSFLDSDTKTNPDLSAYLGTWFYVSLKYLCRCLHTLMSDIATLFYLSSTNRTLEIEGGSSETRVDILRFISSCGIAEMIGAPTHTYSSCEKQPSSATRSPVRLKFAEDGSYSFSGVGMPQAESELAVGHLGTFSSFTNFFSECDQYCKEWAKLMLEGERDNPMFLKRVTENFKLTTVQSMNTFKRLLTDADTDYYALYRAFVFLKNSKQGTMLLQHAKLHATGTISDVLSVLEHFIPA